MEAEVKNQDVLKSPGQAAGFLGASIQTLANWRATGRYSLPYVKVGRLVRYRESDLVAFIAANTVAPQSVREA
ncbi:helix-turn-helix domain-containing protein [Noviherbaspirillum pedocola]|uniref:Helix-turn-helix domain-containing protein n=1 Tax=Noviherbaspirillum pedocola TaxID=2801341 RepID=A0A934T3F7_9BURK|nr:helix-turn-helix domain-containing protein [Noviherbaspirillum pedocola]MBK4739217.1 helix-turn-helix domain-containing protein [Noviherbaspirillum pedocola]